MSWFSETYQFVLSIIHFWIVLLTGSIVAAGIGAWEHSRGGLSWGLYRYILGLTLLVAVFLAWREQFRRVQGPAQRRSIREQLGAFIGEGHDLMARCADETQPAPEEEANAWAARVEAFLAEHLGDSYVHRFRSGAGLPMGATSIASMLHRNLWSGIRVRLARLEQFVQEYPP